jgi:serine/threonine-protein kinase
MLAVVGGDFAEAERQIGALERLASSDGTEEAHALPASLRVQLLEEEGRTAEAGAAAEAFMNRRDGWAADTREDDWEIAKDVTMRMNRALVAAGKLTRPELAERRAAWVKRWQATPLRGFEWFPAYAYGVTTRDEAREARRAAPDPLPPFRPFVYAEAALGRMAMLEGKPADAITLLRRATGGCFALEDPFTTARAHLWLGQAIEATRARGAAKDACAEYAAVIARWGDAKPRSVTADEARRRARALRCAK